MTRPESGSRAGRESSAPTLGWLPRLARWAPVSVVAVEAVLLVIGRGNLGVAVGFVLALEAVLLALILTTAWRTVRVNRGDRLTAAVHAVLPGAVAALVVLEVGQFRALWLLARGRSHTERPSDVAVHYAAGRGGIYLVVGAVCLIELIAVHLMVPWHWLRAWAWLQWLAFGLSAYAAVWSLAWWAAQRTHPHLITDSELLLRNGTRVVLRVALGAVRAVTPRRRGHGSKNRLMLGGPGGGTNLDIDLIEPVTWSSITERRKRTVTAVSLEVDAPLLAARHLTEAIHRHA